jgi:hypothetical protein
MALPPNNVWALVRRLRGAAGEGDVTLTPAELYALADAAEQGDRARWGRVNQAPEEVTEAEVAFHLRIGISTMRARGEFPNAGLRSASQFARDVAIQTIAARLAGMLCNSHVVGRRFTGLAPENDYAQADRAAGIRKRQDGTS